MVVDFSQFAGKTLILYNDNPAPVPAGDPRNDYFYGNGDESPNGGTEPTKLGYGPSTAPSCRCACVRLRRRLPSTRRNSPSNCRRPTDLRRTVRWSGRRRYNEAFETVGGTDPIRRTPSARSTSAPTASRRLDYTPAGVLRDDPVDQRHRRWHAVPDAEAADRAVQLPGRLGRHAGHRACAGLRRQGDPGPPRHPRAHKPTSHPASRWCRSPERPATAPRPTW